MASLRRTALVAVIGGGSLLAWPTAVGARSPIGECPTAAWELRAAPSGGSGTASVDVNRNGLSCFLEAPEGGGVFTVIDDVARSPHA